MRLPLSPPSLSPAPPPPLAAPADTVVLCSAGVGAPLDAGRARASGATGWAGNKAGGWGRGSRFVPNKPKQIVRTRRRVLLFCIFIVKYKFKHVARHRAVSTTPFVLGTQAERSGAAATLARHARLQLHGGAARANASGEQRRQRRRRGVAPPPPTPPPARATAQSVAHARQVVMGSQCWHACPCVRAPLLSIALSCLQARRVCQDYGEKVTCLSCHSNVPV